MSGRKFSAATVATLNAQRGMAPSQRAKMVRIEGITTQVFPSTARVDFRKNTVSVKAGERFMCVQSARFAGWFYIVRWTDAGIDGCSCGKPNGCVHTRAACAFTAQRHGEQEVRVERATEEMLAGMKGIADRMRTGLAAPYIRQEIDQDAQLTQWTAEELEVA